MSDMIMEEMKSTAEKYPQSTSRIGFAISRLIRVKSLKSPTEMSARMIGIVRTVGIMTYLSSFIDGIFTDTPADTCSIGFGMLKILR